MARLNAYVNKLLQKTEKSFKCAVQNQTNHGINIPRVEINFAFYNIDLIF